MTRQVFREHCDGARAQAANSSGAVGSRRGGRRIEVREDQEPESDRWRNSEGNAGGIKVKELKEQRKN